MSTNAERPGAPRACENRRRDAARRQICPALFALLIPLASAGCLSVKDELAREQVALGKSWETLAETGRPARTLTWDEALAQVRAHNPKVKSSALEVLRAGEALDQVRRSLIPTVNLQAGYNRALDNGANAGFDPFYFATNLFFDVPGLVNFRVRHEAAVLTLTRARLMREMVWREQVTELYRLALANGRMEARTARVRRELEALDAVAGPAPRIAAQERNRVQALQTRLAGERMELQARLGDVLGLPGVPVAIAAGGLPPLRYEQAAGRPAPAQLAQLPLRLAAIDLVALRARQLGVRLRSWPEVTVSVSSPTIYRRTDGRDNYWSSSDVFVGLNTYWALDTQGRNASQARLAKAELANRRETLEQEAARMAAKLRLALDSLGRTDARLADLQRTLAAAPAAWRGAMLDSRDALEDERHEWQLVLWFFDDAGWPAEPDGAKPAAMARAGSAPAGKERGSS